MKLQKLIYLHILSEFSSLIRIFRPALVEEKKDSQA